MSLCFLHLSDLHFLRDYSGVQGMFREVYANMQPPLEQLEALLRELPRRPDFALITGDLVDGGGLADYTALKALLDAALGVPYFTTPGNHDDLALYRQVFLGNGPLNHTETVMGMRVLCLNSADEQKPDGAISDESFGWLRNALSRPFDGEATLLMTHHHLLENQFVLDPAQGCGQLERLLSGSPVTAVLCGHTHHYFAGQLGGIPYYTADSVSFRGENLPDGSIDFWQNSGLSLFELEDGRLSCTRLRTRAPRRLTTVAPSDAIR